MRHDSSPFDPPSSNVTPAAATKDPAEIIKARIVFVVFGLLALYFAYKAYVTVRVSAYAGSDELLLTVFAFHAIRYAISAIFVLLTAFFWSWAAIAWAFAVTLWTLHGINNAYVRFESLYSWELILAWVILIITLFVSKPPRSLKGPARNTAAESPSRD